VCAVVGDNNFESGWGNSKKDAEQQAALNALKALGEIEEESMLVLDDLSNHSIDME
jgi:dsRNA-specific ribonuclease